MDKLVDQYLKDHENAWSESTLRSERYRLVTVQCALRKSKGDVQRAYGILSGRVGPYSLKTTWARLCHFQDWCIENGHAKGPNVYKQWRKKNARLFKHAYKRSQPQASYQEVRSRIERLPEGQFKQKCLELLSGGLRYSESFNRDGDYIIGKGGKRRRVYSKVRSDYRASYSSFRRKLISTVGVRPHDLRKLAATEFGRRGLVEQDLLKVMGWESMETAKSYLQPKRDEELERIIGGE